MTDWPLLPACDSEEGSAKRQEENNQAERRRAMKKADTNDSSPAPFAPATCSVTFLKCDHIRLGMNAITMTPGVAIACGVAVEWQPAQFLAGCALGVWVSMWLVVLWAWLTMRQSPNDPDQRPAAKTQ